ncbi:Cell wall-associated hydrolase, NlpC family [Raineyella antarctica]|uniref:Cell wall-associated hydrolase, NlpC family n=1 Tax=Raineyella antarctica TaxID=1577474 RepID=A0A1G6H6K4_9ACTN|nr:C40 family peptidase [Raineyella antarctica]SDB89804.1 Cell wall-associated hydrolase, NlpC family [Raineyella antarctica]
MSKSTFTTPRRSAGTTIHTTRRAHAVAAHSAGFTGTSAARRAGLAAVAGLVTVGVVAPAAAHAEAYAPAGAQNTTYTVPSTTSTTSTTTGTASTSTAKYTTVALNVRIAASIDSPRVTTLAAGTKVTTTGTTSGGWTQISHDGAKRWVSSQYLTSTSPAGSRSATTSRSADRTAMNVSVDTSGLSAKRAAIVKAAYQGIGSGYVYGGTTFGAWDCSGFVLWATSHAGISLPRTSQAQAAALTRTSNPQPGDLVLQNGGGHIGIYVGNGMMISALNPSEGTKLHPVSWMPVAGYYTYS